MSKIRSKSLCYVFVVVLCTLAGCLGTGEDSGPFDDEGLRLLSVSRKDSPRLIMPGKEREIDLTKQQTNDLVDALRPIKSVKIGKLPPDKAAYILFFQPGRNPVTFNVYLADDHLVYAERKYLYEGGNSQEFKKVVDSIESDRSQNVAIPKSQH